MPAQPIEPSCRNASRKWHHRKSRRFSRGIALCWPQEVSSKVAKMRHRTTGPWREAEFKTFVFEEDHADFMLLAV